MGDGGGGWMMDTVTAGALVDKVQRACKQRREVRGRNRGAMVVQTISVGCFSS